MFPSLVGINSFFVDFNDSRIFNELTVHSCDSGVDGEMWACTVHCVVI